MATAKREENSNNTQGKLIACGIVAAIFFAIFVIGSVTKPQTVETHKEPETEEVKPEEKTVYFDCPLSYEIQDYIFEVCTENDVPPSLVIALIDSESQFDPNVISPTADYGLMQINVCNHEWLSETYGITDFLDPKQNILGGVKILANIYPKYDNPHYVVMAYHMGESGAETARENGVTSTEYSKEVVSKWYMYQVDHDMEEERNHVQAN